MAGTSANFPVASRPNTVHHFAAYDENTPLPSIGSLFAADPHQAPSFATLAPMTYCPMAPMASPHLVEMLMAPLSNYCDAAPVSPAAHRAPFSLSPTNSLTSLLKPPGGYLTLNSYQLHQDLAGGSSFEQPEDLSRPLASRSEMSAAMGRDDATSLFMPELEAEPPRAPKQPAKRRRRKEADDAESAAAVAAIETRPTVRIVSEPPSLGPTGSEAALIERFLATSRDFQLVAVLSEYGQHLAVEWRRSADGVAPVGFECRVAGCRFGTGEPAEIVRHMRASNDCDQCPRRFHTAQQLEQHVQTVHSAKHAGQLCDDCGLSFRTEAGFTYHKQHVHCICPVCFLRGADADRLAEHLRGIHDGFGLNSVCDDCGDGFMTVAQLARHRAQQHQDSLASADTSDDDDGGFPAAPPRRGRVKCQICGKMLSAVSMRIHIRRNHNKEKRFKCEYCEYEAYDTFILREHTRRHLGEYRYHCGHCDFVAVKKYQLDSHMRRHSGEKPFKCDQCDFAATWNVQLKAHKEAHDSAEKTSCEQCNIVFKDARGLKRHNKAAHSNGGAPPHAGHRRKSCLKLDVVKTAISTTVNNFRPSREQSLRMRLRSAAKQPPASPNSPGRRADSALIIVNRSSDVRNQTPVVTCKRDDLMTLMCSPDDAASCPSNVVVVPPEML